MVQLVNRLSGVYGRSLRFNQLALLELLQKRNILVIRTCVIGDTIRGSIFLRLA